MKITLLKHAFLLICWLFISPSYIFSVGYSSYIGVKNQTSFSEEYITSFLDSKSNGENSFKSLHSEEGILLHSHLFLIILSKNKLNIEERQRENTSGFQSKINDCSSVNSNLISIYDHYLLNKSIYQTPIFFSDIIIKFRSIRC